MSDEYLTAEEYTWALDHVSHYKRINLPLPDVDGEFILLLLKNGNMAIGKTFKEAVRMEMDNKGEVVETEIENIKELEEVMIPVHDDEDLRNYLERK